MNHVEVKSSLLSPIDTLLSSLRAEDWSPFLHSRGGGLKHSLALDENATPSIANTAEVCRLHREYPEFLNVDDATVSRWIDDTLKPELERQTEKLRLDQPAAQQNAQAAYRIAQICRALDEAPPDVLAEWVGAYCDSWLVGGHPRVPAMYLLNLAASVCRFDRSTGNKLRAVAEQTLWRNLALAAHSPTGWDPVDTAYSLLHVGPDVPGSMLMATAELLLKSAQEGSTWPVRPPVAGCGFPASSSFEALFYLLEAYDGSTSPVMRTLAPAVVAHIQWLLSSPTRDHTQWRACDLTFRLPHPEPWFNCLTVYFLVKVKNWITDAAQQEILSRYAVGPGSSRVPWEHMVLDPEYHTALTDAFVTPVLASPSGRPSSTTAILFGPPGTAKTTIAESLAARIQWPLLEIGVSDFLRGGLDRVFEQSHRIFADLLHLRRVVILLDEVEGVFANRDPEQSALLQRLLTASLLPPLKRLRDHAEVIVLIATNHIRTFDPAAYRPGRVDLVVPVGPPSETGRKTLLVGCGVEDAVAAQAAKDLGDFVTIGELLRAKHFDSSAKADHAKFTVAWQKAHGTRRVISEDALRDFDRDRREFGRLG